MVHFARGSGVSIFGTLIALLSLAGTTFADPPLPILDAIFIQTFTGSQVVGTCSVKKGDDVEGTQQILAGIVGSLTMTITSVTRVSPGNPGNWQFVAQIQGLINTTLTMTLPVSFQGPNSATTVVTIPTFVMPGLEDYGRGFVRGEVTFNGTTFSGMWCAPSYSGCLGGELLPPPPQGTEGQNPGFWKNHIGDWQFAQTTDSFEAIFGVDAPGNLTLLHAVQLGGGGENALIRQAAAALLNALHQDVDYAFTVAEVIQIVQTAYATNDFDTARHLLQEQNNIGGSL